MKKYALAFLAIALAVAYAGNIEAQSAKPTSTQGVFLKVPAEKCYTLSEINRMLNDPNAPIDVRITQILPGGAQATACGSGNCPKKCVCWVDPNGNCQMMCDPVMTSGGGGD